MGDTMSLYALIGFGFACAAIYYLAPKRLRFVVLLLASYAFYAAQSAAALLYILLTTASTWAGALYIGRAANALKAELKEKKAVLSAQEKKALKAAAKKKQRIAFLAVLLLNFGLLAFLKYFNYTAHHAASLLSLISGTRIAAPRLNLLLPLGISFYTFQSMGYLIDVYNGKYAPEANPAKFALFVSFFPQLIQGPIGRYDALAPQLLAPNHFDGRNIFDGATLILWGFFKKKVIADRALPLVAAVFGDQSAYGGAVIVLAVLFYSLQQYADFSGGIDIVTGIAQLMGVRLAPNFKRPYFSTSLGDFWRRWHISLGSWMRDYVFYPFALTGPMTRLSKALRKRGLAHLSRALPAALGNILVFLLVGVWHGAQLNYVAWGLYNGAILAASALLEPVYKRAHERLPQLKSSRAFYLFCVLRTFVIVNIGWYFDRCERFSDSFKMLYKTLLSPRLAQLSDGTLMALGLSAADFAILAVATALLFAVSLAQERGVQMRAWLCRLKTPVRWLILYAFVFFVFFAAVGDSGAADAFMYAIF